MDQLIAEKLAQIEREEDVRILHAVESGSRAWGFPSSDSDYDVRLIYVRKPEYYLKLEKTRDVIELPINDTWTKRSIRKSSISPVRLWQQKMQVKQVISIQKSLKLPIPRNLFIPEI